ncbi:MAG: NUDIX hydrolase [Elainellaceae cyanobacterium]
MSSNNPDDALNEDLTQEPQWLRWAKEIQAIAQIGLTYTSGSEFDVERYHRLRAIAAEMMATHGNLGPDVVLGLFEREDGYATPKVDVRGAVFQDGKLLMVQEASDGKWAPPGGWADVNDSPSEAVTREIWEESGYETRATKIIAVCDRTLHGHLPLLPFHVYKLFIQCELIGGEPKVSIETQKVDFFGEDELPELSPSRVTLAQIHRLFEHYRHPDLPTYFD